MMEDGRNPEKTPSTMTLQRVHLYQPKKIFKADWGTFA